MILLCGLSTDRVLKYLCRFLIEKKKEVVFLNQEKILKNLVIENNEFTLNNCKYKYKDFTGVLNRIVSVSFNEKTNFNFKFANSVGLLNSLISTKFSNVLNCPSFCVSNDTKLFQITSIKKNFIKTPISVVLSKQNLLCNNDQKKMVFKSLSSIRSIVKEASNVEKSRHCYDIVLFQELLNGDNIRVHFVNNKCIATKIISNQVDYRYDPENRKFYDFQLPDKIEQECKSIAYQLGLRFCGIDLIKLKNSYYILEVNPSPGYNFYEQNLPHFKISEELMENLSV